MWNNQERERETETERHTARDRERGRDRDRETVRDTQRDRDSETHREAKRHMHYLHCKCLSKIKFQEICVKAPNMVLCFKMKELT